MDHLNNEELKHVCSRLLTYEEDSTSIKGLLSILVAEAIEEDKEIIIAELQERANLLIFDSQIAKLNSLGLIEVQLDDDGEEICFIPEELALELEREENESCRN
jgi:hypothetical protein